MLRRHKNIIRALLLILAATSLVAPARADTSVTVFAAASLKNALDAVAADWKTSAGKNTRISYEGSSVLAKQIEQGAPADVFISADTDWMDYLDKRKLIEPGTRKTLLGNHLVLIAPADSKISLDIKPGFDLVGALKGGRLAMADTKGVPAGKYGKAALEKLGVWRGVESQVAQAENVRAALAFVARGETPLGIVYQTDASVEPKVKIVATFPDDTHAPIVYPAGLIAGKGNADAVAFLAYLSSPAASAVFARYGFVILH